MVEFPIFPVIRLSTSGEGLPDSDGHHQRERRRTVSETRRGTTTRDTERQQVHMRMGLTHEAYLLLPFHNTRLYTDTPSLERGKTRLPHSPSTELRPHRRQASSRTRSFRSQSKARASQKTMGSDTESQHHPSRASNPLSRATARHTLATPVSSPTAPRLSSSPGEASPTSSAFPSLARSSE